jgi:Sec-independent protein translocase protein TatA
MLDETGSFDFSRMIKVLVGTIFNTLTAPIRLLLEGLAKLAEKIPFKGDDIAAGIRSFKGKLTMDTGVDEAIQNVENKNAASQKGENLNKQSTELKAEERAAGPTPAEIVNAVATTNNSTKMGDNYVITTPPAVDSISTGLTNR